MITLEDREVNVLSLFRFIISRWMFILIIAIISAVLGLGFGYKKYKAGAANEEKKVLSESEINDLYQSLTPDEQDRVDYIVFLNEKLKDMKLYMDNNPIMKLNPYNVPVTYYQYNIVPNDNSYTDELEKIQITNNLRSAYNHFIQNGELAHQLVELYPKGSLTEDVLNEMIDLSYDSQLFGSSVMTVSIRLFQKVPDLETNVHQLISNYSNELSKTMAGHKIDVLSVVTSKVRSDYVSELQEKIRARYDNTRNSIRLMKFNSELSDKAIKYYESRIEEDGYHLNAESNTYGASASKKTILKYGVLLTGAGLLLICLILGVYYLLFVYGRFVVSKEDFECFRLKYLGDLTVKNQLNSIILKICGYCSRNEIDRIAMISTDLSMISKESLDELKQRLQEKNIDVSVVGPEDVNNNTYMEHLLTVCHCLLIEKINKTKINSLKEMVDNCFENEVDIIGVLEES